jgi:hypothetical protein
LVRAPQIALAGLVSTGAFISPRASSAETSGVGETTGEPMIVNRSGGLSRERTPSAKPLKMQMAANPRSEV